MYELIYNLIYFALTKDGKDELFGRRIEADSDVLKKSFAGSDFPEIWFELPLLGDAWYDLHVLTSRSSLEPEIQLPEGILHPELFRWFSKSQGTRQLAMSHDLSKGIYDSPAVQLLIGGCEISTCCDFLSKAGNPAATPAYRAFRDRIPKEWFACYLGTFPQRDDLSLRVECIPTAQMQKTYSEREDLLRRDLSMAGFRISDEMLKLVKFMACQPFPIEFQFNVDKEGCAAPVLGVSLRFLIPGGRYPHLAFSAENKSVISLMSMLSSEGLCDKRWQMLPGCAFARRISAGSASVRFGGYTAFIKVRMTPDRLTDAKAYIVAKVFEPC
ncbi:MAG: hypothetical protein J5829_10630 [Lachnospiraceae bacterium]|nr:hypothetical protein [Lachnospiraceae bacterium]